MSPNQKLQSIQLEPTCEGPRLMGSRLSPSCTAWEAPYFVGGHFFCFSHYNQWKSRGGAHAVRLDSIALKQGKCDLHFEFRNPDGSPRIYENF